jgi:hypothetical protein
MDNISNEKMQIENTSPPQKPIKEKWIEMPIRSSVEAMRYIYGGFILNAIIFIINIYLLRGEYHHILEYVFVSIIPVLSLVVLITKNTYASCLIVLLVGIGLLWILIEDVFLTPPMFGWRPGIGRLIDIVGNYFKFFYHNIPNFVQFGLYIKICQSTEYLHKVRTEQQSTPVS